MLEITATRMWKPKQLMGKIKYSYQNMHASRLRWIF
jgi:hypothetical protein